ncbi:unnamed protein product [Phaeothamnion confervicola]
MAYGFRPRMPGVTRPRRNVRMAAGIAPPKAPPRNIGYGGGGNEPYVREIDDDERQLVLTNWLSYARRKSTEEGRSSGRDFESVAVIADMLPWRRGPLSGRKRRFSLAACRGEAVDAIACLQVGPDNSKILSFLSQELVMTVQYITVNPKAAKLGAGTFLVRQVKEVGKVENIRVDFSPLQQIYAGRFYLAATTL